jgi:hypothetical protein
VSTFGNAAIPGVNKAEPRRGHPARRRDANYPASSARTPCPRERARAHPAARSGSPRRWLPSSRSPAGGRRLALRSRPAATRSAHLQAWAAQNNPFGRSAGSHAELGLPSRTADIACQAPIELSPSVTETPAPGEARRLSGEPIAAGRSRHDDHHRDIVNSARGVPSGPPDSPASNWNDVLCSSGMTLNTPFRPATFRQLTGAIIQFPDGEGPVACGVLLVHGGYHPLPS